MSPPILGFKKAFSEILINNPNSDSSELIKKIRNKYPNNKDLYSILDSISHKAGIGILAIPVVDTNDRDLGYQPHIKYYPNNLLSETPRTEILAGGNFMPLQKCYEFLAKELIYRLIRVKNIHSIV